jgi:hypothetical protein
MPVTISRVSSYQPLSDTGDMSITYPPSAELATLVLED